jgi:hypothetical protein
LANPLKKTASETLASNLRLHLYRKEGGLEGPANGLKKIAMTAISLSLSQMIDEHAPSC